MLDLQGVAAARPGRRCAVGVGRASPADRLALGRFARSPFVRPVDDAEALLRALETGVLQAGIRGTLPAEAVVRALAKHRWGHRVQRGALLEPRAGQGVFLGPVGITEGRGASARARFGLQAASKLSDHGLLTEPPLVAVLSLGRPEDAPRGARIARSLKESARVVELLQRRGLDAFHAGVQLEDVIFDADIVVAPDGASGNLAFRALHLAGGMRSFGGILLGSPLAFVDTSRARASFEAPVRLAAYLASSGHAP